MTDDTVDPEELVCGNGDTLAERLEKIDFEDETQWVSLEEFCERHGFDY